MNEGTATRDNVLAALRKAAEGAAPEGLYDTGRHRRIVAPGPDQTSGTASMVSWHESFHAFLNASTTYGTAMILSGGLASAGLAGLDLLVGRMVDRALQVHETYATVASVCAVSRGAIDPLLLVSYPDYQPFLREFLECFDPARPRLSAMALTSAARAAMQTAIYERLFALPCARWSETEFPPDERPDERFRLILTPDGAARALAAVDRALARETGPLAPLARAGATPSLEIECLLRATLRDQEIVNVAAFESYADQLERQGVARPDYEGQKRGLGALVEKAKQAGGAALAIEFRMPGEGDDRDALLHDFRNEITSYGSLPVDARTLDGRHAPIETVERFGLRAGDQPYFQLVAMPAAKARHLYRGENGSDPLLGWTGESVTFLRCGRRDAAGIRVELLLLDGAHADAVNSTFAGHLLVFTASLATIRDPDWRAQWPEREGQATPLLVLIDDDPFDLVGRLAARGSPVRFAGLTAGLRPGPDAQKIELLCISADDEPDLLYVMPTGAPYREAIVDVALRTVAGTIVDKSILSAWVPLLGKAVPHWVSEERMFGARFWE